MRALVGAILIAAAVQAQTPKQDLQVLVKTDTFTGVKEFYTEPAKVREPSWKDGLLAGLENSAGQKASQGWSLRIAFSTNNPDSGPYRLLLGYMDETWLFIPDGESLAFNADGTFITLSGPGSATRRETRRGGINELAIYTITPEQLNTLAKAAVLQVRVTGTKGVRTITWEKDRRILSDFTTFINQKRKTDPEATKPQPPAQAPPPTAS